MQHSPIEHPEAQTGGADRRTTVNAHLALWCSIVGMVVGSLDNMFVPPFWLVLAPVGCVAGICEYRKASGAGRSLGVPIAAAIIGGLAFIAGLLWIVGMIVGPQP